MAQANNGMHRTRIQGAFHLLRCLRAVMAGVRLLPVVMMGGVK